MPTAPSEYVDVDEAFHELQLLNAVERAIDLPLADAPRPAGPAAYVVRYIGRCFPLYEPLRASYWPVYVGKVTAETLGRLRDHRLSIGRVVNLDLDDFVVNLIEAPSAATAEFLEGLAIQHYRPLWNVVLTGFGQKSSPGRAREAAQRVTRWDCIHPGRRHVSRNRPWDLDDLVAMVRAHLERSVPLA